MSAYDTIAFSSEKARKMSNIQSVPMNLLHINSTSNTNSAIASSSTKKQYFPQLTPGKENINTDCKQSATTEVSILKRKFLNVNDKYRPRKLSDNINQLKRKEEIAASTNIHPLFDHCNSKMNVHLDVHRRRHLSENVKSSTSSQAIHDSAVYPKSDFKVYSNNEKMKDASCSKNSSCLPKGENGHFEKPKIISVTTVTKKFIFINSPQNQIEKATKDSSRLKIKNPQVPVSKTEKNAANSITPIIDASAPLNTKKIKVHHKKSALDENYIKTQFDNLPSIVTYNLEYMEDFMAFQLVLELSHKLSAEFLTKNVTGQKRRMVVAFIIRVTTYCTYPSIVLFQAVKIFDNVLDLKRIEVDQLQLVALSALWIALKRLHTRSNVPAAREILGFTKNVFTEKELCKCEMDIMITLKYEVSFIDPYSILAYYFIMIDSPFITVTRADTLYYVGSYMMDLSLLSSTFCTMSTFVIIAAAAELALFIALAPESDLQQPHWQFWRQCLPKSKQIFGGAQLDVAAIDETRKKLIKLALLSNNLSKDYVSVYKKYKRSRYGCISQIVIEKLLKVSQDD